MEIVIVNTQQTTKNMNVEQALLKDSVSSVEFCKHVKFDDNKRDHRDNNQTGTQDPAGPPGATGATGPQGIQGIPGLIGPNGTQGIQGPRGFNGTDGVNGTQGPPRLNRIDPTDLYLVEGTVNSTVVGGGLSSTSSRAMCNPGDTIFIGCYFISNSGLIDNISDFPAIPTSNFNGWEASIDENDPNRLSLPLEHLLPASTIHSDIKSP